MNRTINGKFTTINAVLSFGFYATITNVQRSIVNIHCTIEITKISLSTIDMIAIIRDGITLYRTRYIGINTSTADMNTGTYVTSNLIFGESL